MKNVLVLLFALMSAHGQSRLVPMAGTPGPDPSTIAKGSVKEEPEQWRYTSEDGKVEFVYPRTDLVKPSVKVTVNGDVYTYLVTNSPDAKASIDIIRLEPGVNDEGTEVSTPRGFIFGGVGWMVVDDDGIKPGHSAVFKLRQRRMSPAIRFMNAVAAVPELPDETPYGLLVLFHQWGHEHLGVRISTAAPAKKALE